MSLATSSAALINQEIKVEEADRPVVLRLKADHLRGTNVHTHRCIGCGEKGETSLKKYVFRDQRVGAQVIAALLVFGGMFGTVFTWYWTTAIFVSLFRVVTKSHGLEPVFVVASLLFSVLVNYLVCRLLGDALIKHVKTAFARCHKCAHREWLGLGLRLVVSVVACLAPLVLSLGWLGTLGVWGPAAGILTAISGVLMTLWLSPLFRAGSRMHVLVKAVSQDTLRIQVPPTFHSVLLTERPDLFRR